MSSSDPPNADLDNDGEVTAAEISRLRAAGKTASWTVEQAISVARESGASLTDGARRFLNASALGGASDLLGDTFRLLTSPVGFIIDVVKDWIYPVIVNPLFRAVLFIPILLVALITAVFWGTDHALQRDINGVPGIGDIPIFVANLIVGALQPLAASILATVRFMNRQLVGAVASEGGALTVPLLAVLQMVELGVLLFLLWTGVRFAATLPVGAQAAAALRTIVRPLKTAIGVIR